jgi:nitrite reductase/ring-hydroxylating ferredoxin subunit
MASEKLIPLANVSDIPLGSCTKVRGPEGEEIALFNVQEGIFALDNACPHEGGPLAEGELNGCIVTCPWHCWQFDVTTGACQNMPGIDARQIEISVENGVIYMKPKKY